MNTYRTKFFGSIFLGLALWGFFYVMTPFEKVLQLSNSTIAFIVLSYLFLILGFWFSPVVLKPLENVQNTIKEYPLKVITILSCLVLFSYLMRYIDLFFIRDVSIFNSGMENKRIASNPENFSNLFAVLAIFRLVYFVPLILYFGFNINRRKLIWLCVFLFLLPLFEGFLRDSRRIFFESFLLFGIIVLFANKINFRSFKTYLFTFIGLVGLLSYSFFVLQGRTNGGAEFYKEITSSQYNEFVPIQKVTLRYIEENQSKVYIPLYYSGMHIGQYIIHGVYEMEHMKRNFKKHEYGKYNGYLIVKLFNKLGITNIDLNSLNNPTNRYTYLTFFGALYIDFGWLALIVMFIFGAIQKQVFALDKQLIFLQPLTVLFFFSNIFLLVMNFLRAQFLLNIGFYLFLILSFYFVKKVAIKK